MGYIVQMKHEKKVAVLKHKIKEKIRLKDDDFSNDCSIHEINNINKTITYILN
jgi:hypothetical protein